MNVRRLAACTAGLWAGLILAIAAIAAPSAFASVPRVDAGRIVARMFQQEAYLSLGLAVALLLMTRRLARTEAQNGQGSVLSTNVVLVLGTLFCTMFGYFALQPMMAEARAGQGAWSFGALHGVSVVFFGLKGLLALTLAWRLSAPGPTP